MIYHRRFTVAAPVEEVAAFHRTIDSFLALAPPGVPVRIRRGRDPLSDGTDLEFTLWLGLVPVRWHARIDSIGGLEGGEGFVDRQVAGPFAAWEHRHRFEPLGPHHTVIDDRIEARLALQPWRALLGLVLWSGLPLLFRWRAWQTRRRLSSRISA